MSICDARCWTPTTCPVCGRVQAPQGRSLPLALAGAYCDNEHCGAAPTLQHLWDEHDDDRSYTDPEGWAAHEASCERCGGQP